MHAEIDQPASGRGLSILIVEDEFLIAIDLVAILENNGHSVVGPSSSIEQALQLLETERPDVAVLDVNLRGQFVTPVAERLRSLSIPFVLCSAYQIGDFNGYQILKEATNIGKPIDAKRLFAALDRCRVV